MTYMLAERVALRRPMPPGSFTIDETNDYFGIRLLDPKTKQRFIAKGVVPQGLIGLWFNGHSEKGYECVILKRYLPEFDFQGEHYYHGYTFRTDNPLQYIWNWLSGHAYRYGLWDRWTQGQFNKRGLTRQDRIQVLRLFVNETAKNDGFHVSMFGLMELLYTRRWFRHPEGDTTNNYYELVLKSLADSGDLEVADHGLRYTLKPQGLTTVASYELEERRHHDNIKQQSRLGLLTLATYYAPGGAAPAQPSVSASR